MSLCGWWCSTLTYSWLVSRPVIDLRASNALGSAALGIGIFVLWVLPDALWPGYRQSVIFQNAITGRTVTSLPVTALLDPVVLALRSLRVVRRRAHH